jgi:hypothetical protein
VVVGVAIVEWLNNSHAVSTTKRSVAPAIDFALGVIFLLRLSSGAALSLARVSVGGNAARTSPGRRRLGSGR